MDLVNNTTVYSTAKSYLQNLHLKLVSLIFSTDKFIYKEKFKKTLATRHLRFQLLSNNCQG